MTLVTGLGPPPSSMTSPSLVRSAKTISNEGHLLRFQVDMSFGVHNEPRVSLIPAVNTQYMSMEEEREYGGKGGTRVSHSVGAFPHEGRMKGWSPPSVAEKGPRLQTLSAEATMVLAKRGHPQAPQTQWTQAKSQSNPALASFFLGEHVPLWAFPGGASDKEPVCPCSRHKRRGFDP